MANNNGIKTLIGGMLVGSAVGTLLGLLVAPRSGKQTRQILKKSADALPEIAEDLSTSVQIQSDRLLTSTLQKLDETLIRLKEAITAGVEASQQEAQEIQKISALNQKNL